MTLPFALPDWVPWWVQLVILVAVILVAGAFILMPFSVFGVKARLDTLDARLDELQADIRDLAYRLPDPEMRRPAAWRRPEPEDETYYTRPPYQPQSPSHASSQPPRRDEPPLRPPIPPAPVVPERERASAPFRPRSEPQLRWPSERD